MKMDWTAVATIVAVIALIQPWAIALWKKYYRRGKLEIYQTGNLIIGYGLVGPLISVSGTLRSMNQDLFVERIDLELIKVKDRSRHFFEWGLFLGSDMVNQDKFEMPSSFMVSTSSPHRFNIQFHDTQVQQEMIQEAINPLQQEWIKKKDAFETDPPATSEKSSRAEPDPLKQL